MKNKIILGLLATLCIISLQMAYAESEFSFKFGSTGTNNDKFDNPTDVILDKNAKNIYVVDSNNDRISVFKDKGNFDFGYGAFCNMVDVQNCNDRADGADVKGDGQFNNPLAIARDALGKFFVADSDNERIQVFREDGKFKSKFGSSNSGLKEYLGSAKGITIQDSAKKIIVSNIEKDSISVFNAAGTFLSEFNSFDGNKKFKNPTNMVIDNSKEILFVADSGNDRIVIFELVTGKTCPSGTSKVVDGICFVEEFGSLGSDKGEFNNPIGLAYDSTSDLLYVADSGNDRIVIFELVTGKTCPSGTNKIIDGICFVEEFGSTGTSNGKFDIPMGIALDTSNDLLYVADSSNDRIQAFKLNSGPIISLPDRPNNLKATPVSPTSIIISWDQPNIDKNISAITGYKMEYKLRSGDYVTITENSASTSTSFIHQGLDSNETYYYRVYSINSEGTSVSSANVSDKPEHTITPTALIANAISPNQIKLSWSPPSETFKQSIGGYDIKREVIPGVYDTVGNTNSGTTTFVVTGLTTGKTYTFAITANIGFGSTGESPTASATPKTDSTNTFVDPIRSTAVQMEIPSPPIKLTASIVSSSQINLAWSAPVKDGNSPILGYKIEVKRDDNSYTTLVEDTKSTTRTYSHKNLNTNSMYTYKVSAINDVGTSNPSNKFSETPKSTNIQLRPLGKLTIDEGKLLFFTAKLVDNSISDVIFSLDKNPPGGAKMISNTGAFSWTPTSSDGGKTYTFDIVAKKDGLSDSETLTVTVNDIVSSPPPVAVVEEPKEKEPKEAEPKEAEPKEAEPKEAEPKEAEPKEKEPKELGIASFVDQTKDPQSYVERYNNEVSYKKWFDDNFVEYDSIYHAVGLEEPIVEKLVVEEKKFGICGPGTMLIDDVCTIIDRPDVKPWWQFW